MHAGRLINEIELIVVNHCDLISDLFVFGSLIEIIIEDAMI